MYSYLLLNKTLILRNYISYKFIYTYTIFIFLLKYEPNISIQFPDNKYIF